MDHRELLLLRAARETGVLDALVSDADDASEVAERAGVTPRAARLTVDALLEMGLLERVGDGVEPTNRMLGFVTKTDVRSIGRLPHALDELERLVALPETMRAGDPPAVAGETTRNRLGSLAAEDDSAVRASVTAAVRERPAAERVLVVQDGAGRHAVEFARRGFDVTVLADAAVVDAVGPLLDRERVDLVAADPLAGVDAADGNAPDGFDLVVHVGVAREYGPDANRRLLANARDALRADGVAVHVDAFADDGVDPGLAAAVLAGTEAGDVYGEAEVGAWFETAGFANVRAGDVPGTGYRFVAGRRRAID